MAIRVPSAESSGVRSSPDRTSETAAPASSPPTGFGDDSGFEPDAGISPEAAGRDLMQRAFDDAARWKGISAHQVEKAKSAAETQFEQWLTDNPKATPEEALAAAKSAVGKAWAKAVLNKRLLESLLQSLAQMAQEQQDALADGWTSET